jgi:gamma-glutamyl:cysteine ligase YbdK (ATP-grasp superfamily)
VNWTIEWAAARAQLSNDFSCAFDAQIAYAEDVLTRTTTLVWPPSDMVGMCTAYRRTHTGLKAHENAQRHYRTTSLSRYYEHKHPK